MDMSLNYSEDDTPLALKTDFILSFCELAAGGRKFFRLRLEHAVALRRTGEALLQ